MSPTNESAKAKTSSAPETFTAEERAAMKDRANEAKTSARRGRATPADDLADVFEKIGEMSEDDRAIAERIHALVTENAPELRAKLWYGQPAYAKDGKVVCFFQAASKFKTRYATLGFNETAALDDGTLWPVAFAVKGLTAADEKQIAALLKKAVG